jgi:hypothetical protein
MPTDDFRKESSFSWKKFALLPNFREYTYESLVRPIFEKRGLRVESEDNIAVKPPRD